GETWGLPQVQQWSRLKGVTVKVDLVPIAVASANQVTGNWQITAKGANASDAEGFYNLWYSGSKANVWHYSNPTMDAAVTQLRSETNPKKQMELWNTATQQWLDDATMVFWYRNVTPTLIRKGMSGVQPYTFDVPDLANLWIAKT